jgi:hypothetical protein
MTSSFVLALALGISAACAARTGSITTSDPPVATLADGRTGTIGFLTKLAEALDFPAELPNACRRGLAGREEAQR